MPGLLSQPTAAACTMASARFVPGSAGGCMGTVLYDTDISDDGLSEASDVGYLRLSSDSGGTAGDDDTKMSPGVAGEPRQRRYSSSGDSDISVHVHPTDGCADMVDRRFLRAPPPSPPAVPLVTARNTHIGEYDNDFIEVSGDGAGRHSQQGNRQGALYRGETLVYRELERQDSRSSSGYAGSGGSRSSVQSSQHSGSDRVHSAATATGTPASLVSSRRTSSASTTSSRRGSTTSLPPPQRPYSGRLTDRRQFHRASFVRYRYPKQFHSSVAAITNDSNKPDDRALTPRKVSFTLPPSLKPPSRYGKEPRVQAVRAQPKAQPTWPRPPAYPPRSREVGVTCDIMKLVDKLDVACECVPVAVDAACQCAPATTHSATQYPRPRPRHTATQHTPSTTDSGVQCKPQTSNKFAETSVRILYYPEVNTCHAETQCDVISGDNSDVDALDVASKVDEREGEGWVSPDSACSVAGSTDTPRKENTYDNSCTEFTHS